MTRADGSVAVFDVTRVDEYKKAAFPTSIVYGATPDAELRLITCGGTFDSTTGHYLSNIIAYATLVPERDRMAPAGDGARRGLTPSFLHPYLG